MAVAVYVGKDGASAGLARTGRATRNSDILELPVAEISIERIGAVEIAEVQVTPAITVKISCRYARPVQEVVVHFGSSEREGVGEKNPQV